VVGNDTFFDHSLLGSNMEPGICSSHQRLVATVSDDLRPTVSSPDTGGKTRWKRFRTPGGRGARQERLGASEAKEGRSPITAAHP